MNYTLSNLIENIAGALSPLEYPIYASQTQQGVVTPCFFISLMPSEIQGQLSGRYLNSVSLDIVFLQEPNITNATDQIFSVIDFLDENLDTFEYSDDEETCTLRALDRHYHLEEMDLHYQITIKTRTYVDVNEPLLLHLEDLTYEIKRKG
jgi:hypothetical protein